MSDPNFGNGEVGGHPGWDAPVHGYMDGHGDVTAQFGSGPNEGHTLLRDGHADQAAFHGPRDNRGHDHFDGQGGGTDRGFFSG